MKIWNKSSRLHGVCYDIRGIVLQEADRLESQGVEILKLNIGNTKPFDLLASPHVLDSIAQNLPNSQGYENSLGILPARESIVKYYKQRNMNLDVDNIYIGNGVSELITMSMNALIEAGDEILVPSPDYPLWTASIQLSGGVTMHYRCDESDNWSPDIDDIKRKISSRTKAIVVINPNNPTGAVYEKERLLEIVKVAQDNNLIIYCDEIYERVLYEDAQMHYMATLTGDYPCIFFNGLSKAYRAPGLRCGWMCIHDPLQLLTGYREGLDILSNMRLCSNVTAQWALIDALNNDNTIEELVSPSGRLYQQRKIVLDAIQNIDGVSTVIPKGAMYVFPKFDKKKFNLVNDEKLVLDLLATKHILLVHGKAFNYHDCDHVRIVFLPEPSALQMAMKRIAEFLENYSQ